MLYLYLRVTNNDHWKSFSWLKKSVHYKENRKKGLLCVQTAPCLTVMRTQRNAQLQVFLRTNPLSASDTP